MCGHANPCSALMAVGLLVFSSGPRVRHWCWVLNLAFSLPACLPPVWVTLGATGASAQYPGSSVAFFFLTSPRTTAFTRARQTDPLRAIKPSKREQRGQVLGGLHSELTCSQQGNKQRAVGPAKRPSATWNPLSSPSPMVGMVMCVRSGVNRGEIVLLEETGCNRSLLNAAIIPPQI